MDDLEITCDNEKCKSYGENNFCYGNERDCEIYRIWERKMIKKSEIYTKIEYLLNQGKLQSNPDMRLTITKQVEYLRRKHKEIK